MGKILGEELEQRHSGRKRWCMFGEQQAVPFILGPGMSRRPRGHRCRLGPFRRATYFNFLSNKGP